MLNRLGKVHVELTLMNLSKMKGVTGTVSLYGSKEYGMIDYRKVLYIGSIKVVE